MFNKVFIKIRIKENGKSSRGHIVTYVPEGPPHTIKAMAILEFFKWCNNYYPGNTKHYTQGVLGDPYAHKGEVTIQYKGYETLYYVMQYYKNELI